MKPPIIKKFCGIKPLFFIGWFLFLLPLLLRPTQGLSGTFETNSGEVLDLTEQASWVLTQIRQGKEANLASKFAGEKGRCTIDARFLEKVLTDGFKNARISHHGIKISNATIEGDLNLENAEISYPVYLTHCRFNGKVNLQRSVFKKDLSFQGSDFLKSANFKGVNIEGSAICNGTHFEDESLWCDAKFGEQLQMEGAEFRSKEGAADFNSIKVGDCAFFTAAKFQGPVIFVVSIIGKQFLADDAKFLSPDKQINFGGIKIGRTIFFRKAEFNGPLMFEFAEIGVNIRASGTKFLNGSQSKNFSKIKVGHLLDLKGTLIRGDFDLSYGDFYDVEIDGAHEDIKAGQEKNIAITSLKMKGTLIQRNLNISNVNIDVFNASQMQVKASAIFNNIQINKLADFRSGNLQAVDFQNVVWPAVDSKKSGNQEKKHYRYKVYLGDLTYNSISIDKLEPGTDCNLDECDYSIKDFDRITNFLDECPFYTQSYVQLENFFKRIGREAWANQVFIQMHNRELTEKMRWYDPRRWLEWFFWGKIAGYGRAPFRVFFLSLAFIILGACLFDPKFLATNKMPPGGKLYRSLIIRFFLSLDRFLPIELGLGKHWDYKDRYFLIWFYFQLQQILGWILIPIALASIYSQLK